ncbi:MAG: hypothetical protein RI988_1573 [Pseudomonadota bacterium]|jgi:hypothetical protein
MPTRGLQPLAQRARRNPEHGEARRSSPGPGAARTRELRFTASGSEYFRIWIVKPLLIVVTLGLYLPFGKARRLRDFHANTLEDGQPLAVHGDHWKMFKGFVLPGLARRRVLGHSAHVRACGHPPDSERVRLFEAGRRRVLEGPGTPQVALP